MIYPWFHKQILESRELQAGLGEERHTSRAHCAEQLRFFVSDTVETAERFRS